MFILNKSVTQYILPKMIAIIDYGCGNPTSIKNMLKKCGHDSIISTDYNEIKSAKKLILPGIGSFDEGIKNLHKSNLFDILHKKVIDEKVPILGICLGAQLLFQTSEEGESKGLGWIDGEVIHFDKQRLGETDKVPHMGWSELEVQRNSQLFHGTDEPTRFYFVHSYHLNCRHEKDVVATTVHGYRFAAAVEKDNIAGVQFHPEKSHRFGMVLLNNFVNNF